MTMTKTKRSRVLGRDQLAAVRGGFVTAECTMAKVLTPEQIAGTDDTAALVVDNGSGMCK
jgi:hypothetical protein